MAPSRGSNKSEELRISLLPDRNGKGNFDKRMRGVLIGIIVILLALIGVTSAILRLRAEKYQERVADLIGAAARSREELKKASARAQQFGNLGQRAGVAKGILENHVASEKTLQFMEATIIPEVTLKQLAFDASGTLVVSGRGAQFSSLSRQLLVWKEHPSVKDAAMSSIAVAVDRVGNIEGIDFTATVTVDKTITRFIP